MQNGDRMTRDDEAHRAERRGLMLILSSPSGAGKTTLTRMLLQKKELDLTLSISLTTRKRRSSEADGIHYHFIEKPEFERRRDAGDLLEHAEVHGNYYGSPRGKVEAILAQGRDVLFDIDYQGARQVREKMPQDVVTVFILPPSMSRVAGAAGAPGRKTARTPSPKGWTTPVTRSAAGRIMIFVLVNDDIQKTFDELQLVVHAERLRRPRVAKGMSEFVARLLEEKV